LGIIFVTIFHRAATILCGEIKLDKYETHQKAFRAPNGCVKQMYTPVDSEYDKVLLIHFFRKLAEINTAQ